MMKKLHFDFSQIIDPITLGMKEINKEIQEIESSRDEISYNTYLYNTLLFAMNTAITRLSIKSRGTSFVVKPYLVRVMKPMLLFEDNFAYMRFSLEKRKTSQVSIHVFLQQIREELKKIIYNLEVELDLQYNPEYFQIIEVKNLFEVIEKNEVIIELMLVDSANVEDYLLHNSILAELERED